MTPVQRSEIVEDLEAMIYRHESTLGVSARGKFGSVDDNIDLATICGDIIRLAQAILVALPEPVEPAKPPQTLADLLDEHGHWKVPPTT